MFGKINISNPKGIPQALYLHYWFHKTFFTACYVQLHEMNSEVVGRNKTPISHAEQLAISLHR